MIVNSVSPEFQSSGSDSGINQAVWRTLSRFSGEGEKPGPIPYSQDGFVKVSILFTFCGVFNRQNVEIPRILTF